MCFGIPFNPSALRLLHCGTSLTTNEFEALLPSFEIAGETFLESVSQKNIPDVHDLGSLGDSKVWGKNCR